MGLHRVSVNGVELHYIEYGQGVPVVLVHGGLADYREWDAQIERFGSEFRVIAYSRRYNYPNHNPLSVADHSAITEAADLAALVGALRLSKPHVVGYSYGAFAALLFALEHPDALGRLVLAEPPVHRLALDVPGGRELFDGFMKSLWWPVGAAFRAGDTELALRITFDVFVGPGGFDLIPEEVRQVCYENLREWKALTTSVDAFPAVSRDRVRALTVPTLLLTGGNTLPIHHLVNDELEQILSWGRRVTIPDASHGMWAEQPVACGEAVREFLKA